MDADDAKSLQCFLRDKKKAEARNKLKEVAEFCNCIGEIYSKYGQYEEAIQEHTQELQLGEALGDKIGEAVACRKIGECHCFLGQYELALSLQKRHLVLARSCGNSLEEQRAWATIGKTYFCQSDSRNLVTSALASKKAEKAFTKALEVCEKVKSSVKVEEYMAMKGRLYLNIGLVYDTRGEIKLCADVMKRAVAIAEKFKLLDEQFMCHSSLASMYFKCGQPTQAMRSVDLALKMAEKLRNKVGEKEMYIQKMQIFVSLGDYLAAKHCLKKAYKLKVMSDTADKKLVKMFQCVNKMQDAAVDLETNTDTLRIAELKEILADGLAELGNFSEAVQYYLATLESKDLLTREKLADIYVSLAQTHADLRNYEDAIFYYRQELEERKDNQEQLCRTLLNIAELEELRGSKYSVMCKIYMSAFESARKAKHVKLQIQTLKSLLVLQKACKQSEHLKETEKKLESVVKKHGMSNEKICSSGDEEDGSSDKGNTSEEDDDNVATTLGKSSSKSANDGNLSLSDLTLSVNCISVFPLFLITYRLAFFFFLQRNEKGETPLHRACIDGNLKKAKALIAQGHPVNPRDFCGWLPLHEACNHGHIEVVKCLLDAGAWINDRGGERCGGVTPLIDAANCGNLAIVRLLVSRGASLHAKDDDGNTAVDCLHAWYQRAGDTMGASDVLDYTTTEKLLQVKGQGEHFSKTCYFTVSGLFDANLPFQSHRKVISTKFFVSQCWRCHSYKQHLFQRTTQSSTPEVCLLFIYSMWKISKTGSFLDRKDRSKTNAEDLSSSDEMSDCDYIPHPLPKLPSKSQNGALEYRSAIESIGSSVQKRLGAEQTQDKEKETEQFSSRDSLPALLNEMEDVGDDWLINDVDIIKPKKKNVQVSSLFTTSTSRASSRKRSIEDETALSKRSKLTVQRSKLARLENLPSISSSQDAEGREPSRYRENISRKKKNVQSHPELFDDQSSSDACPVTSSTERHEVVPQSVTQQRNQNPPVDCWDSDDELLSYMDYVDDSFGDNTSGLNISQINTPLCENQTPRSSEHFRDNSSLVLTKKSKISKPHLTLDTLLSEKRNNQRPQESDHVGLGNSCVNFSDSLQQHQEKQQYQHHTSQTLLQQQPQPSQSIAPSTLPKQGPVLRVKVKIGEQTLLIPIQASDQQRTILWLCQQVGQRYFNMFLVRPLVTLNTSDGSVLSPTDSIASVLAENEVLTALVRSWERPKLEERYLQACTLCLLDEPNQHVLPLLPDCDTSGTLKLCDLGLSSVTLQPVFQALEGHRTLTELHLTGNRLGDSGVTPLMELLAGLPILKASFLHSSGLSVEGVRTMAAVLKQKSGTEHGDLCLGALTSLSLGHNSLEDCASPALAALVDHLPRLAHLDLPACGFTEALFTPALCIALQGRRLESLSISENQIKSEGISLLLNSLHADCLHSLDLSHTRPATSKDLLPMVEAFAGQECQLKELSLAGCHLTDNDVTAINRLVVHMRNLTTLSISQNKNVNNRSFQKLLALSTGGVCKLESLTARGCSLTSPLSSELLESLKGKMSSDNPLVKLVFSCRGLKQEETNKVKEIWTQKWKERAQCKIIGVAISLTVAEIR
ncbi:hypothetical protein EGW08_013971 [Elysia chlorotica]|uniref:Tonsoku-like protein n=1 Tax=Elysia chlorotica TaxID=188477 RepID=A0A3S0ZI48_ELYCH|nr:hypothetical protein EGW08_013971 [Elysia chlorotica]